MKILTAAQTKILDKVTIAEQGIESVDLMERAARAFVTWFKDVYENKYLSSNSGYDPNTVSIFCGLGDNGGDGLAIARMLDDADYIVTIYIVRFGYKTSKDFDINLKWCESRSIQIIELDKDEPLFYFDTQSIAIDAILGSGINRSVEGWLKGLINHINESFETIYSVDIASGMFPDKQTIGTSILPTATCTFELPKFAFLFAENEKRTGEWYIQTIDSSENALNDFETPYYYITEDFISSIKKKRSKFAHKGTFGHALMICGSYGMMGAALLSARACLRTGCGLVSLHIPKCGYEIAQIGLPEAMVSIDDNEEVFSNIENISKYNAIGIGCGLGKDYLTKGAVLRLLKRTEVPLVIDADALNIIAEEEWLNLVPKGSVLTPHVKEFERLFGATANDFERNHLHRLKAQELELNIILKGAHTDICTADGNCYFNSTGNHGMATAGSGDVLTGIITSLVAQGYSTKEAAILGVYFHGKAGDFVLEKYKSASYIIASDIIKGLRSI
jgi:NAD(P)H-hydrate epimerase